MTAALRTLFVPLLAIVALVVPAASTVAQASDRLLIEDINALLTSHDIVGGEFRQRIRIAALTRPIESGGRFYFQESQGIAWYVERPLSSSIFIDAEGVLSGPQEASTGGMQWVADITRSLLVGDFDHLAGMFTFTGDVSESDWSIQLRPSEALLQKLFREIHMTGAESVRQIVLHTTSDDRIEIEFLNVQPLDELPAMVAKDMGVVPH